MKDLNEGHTEEYYDNENKVYESFWNFNGNTHWGIFENAKSILEASENLTKYMEGQAKFSDQSKVLNIGCGNGDVDIYLSKKYNCDWTGLDLSGIRIKNAQKKIKNQTNNQLKFVKASAESLPFKDHKFSHILSQSTLYHAHNKQKVLQEISRSLQKDGIFIFDDLVKPQKKISADAQKHVYDRLIFDTPYSFLSYQEALKIEGFKIIDARDETHNMKKTYEELCIILENKIKNNENPEFHERYKELIIAYKETIKAAIKNEIGWAIYTCKKNK